VEVRIKLKTRSFLDRPLYYSRSEKGPMIYHDLSDVLSKREVLLYEKGLCQLMIFGGNFYPYSIFKDIIPFRLEKKKTHSLISDVDEAVKKIRDSFLECSKKIEKDCYIMFSGGLDSTIVMSLMRDKIKKAGCSLYRADYKTDIENAMKYFQNIPLFCLKPDKKLYFEVLKDLEFVHPFINEGMVDDVIHSKKARSENISLLLTGMGADEYLGDYSICKNFDRTPTLEEYLNEYSVFPRELLFNIFKEDIIKEVYDKSMKDFDFSSLKGRIEFVIEAIHIPNQCALADNSRKITEQERFSFFNTPFFRDISLSLTDDMVENNNVEKYILRRAFKGMIPDEIVYKRSKDFDADANLLYSDPIRKDLFKKMTRIQHILNIDKEIIMNLSKRHKIRLYLLFRQLECFFLK